MLSLLLLWHYLSVWPAAALLPNHPPTYITSSPFLFIPLPFCNYLSLRPRGSVIGNPNFQFGVRLHFDMAHIIWFQFHSRNERFEREGERNLGLGELVLICVGGLQVGRHIALTLVFHLFIYIHFLFSIRVCNVKRDTQRRTRQNDRTYPQQIRAFFLCFERGSHSLAWLFSQKLYEQSEGVSKVSCCTALCIFTTLCLRIYSTVKPRMNGSGFKGHVNILLLCKSMQILSQSWQNLKLCSRM